MEVSPYLMFNGTCEQALKFYEQSIGAQIQTMMKSEGSPAAEHMPPDWGDKIIHARFKLGNTVIMASDAPQGNYSQPTGFNVSISLDDPAKGEQLFNKLSEGGSVKMPFGPTFWAKGFGMCVDRF